jgi:hypothetical protein
VSGSCFLKRGRQRYLLSFDRRLRKPSVSSARRSAVGSEDMDNRKKTQCHRTGKENPMGGGIPYLE